MCYLPTVRCTLHRPYTGDCTFNAATHVIIFPVVPFDALPFWFSLAFSARYYRCWLVQRYSYAVEKTMRTHQ